MFLCPGLLKQAPSASSLFLKRTLEFRDVKELTKGRPADADRASSWTSSCSREPLLFTALQSKGAARLLPGRGLQ